MFLNFTSGFTLTEVNSIRASRSKVICCDFSPDGKLLASAGHDKEVSQNALFVLFWQFNCELPCFQFKLSLKNQLEIA